MFNFFRKQKEPVEKYIIAFCDENDIATKFGHSCELFPTYEDAKRRIFSKVNGWGYAIEEVTDNGVRINSAWLIIEKVFVNPLLTTLS